MICDVVVAGVGGQGVLSIAALLGEAALRQGLEVKQSEVHGMSQRGGSVVAHLRMADHAIGSALIPRGAATLIVSLEPLEALRHLAYLAPGGHIVTASEPVKTIPEYPHLESVLTRLRRAHETIVVAAEAIARQSGTMRAANLVVAGAASRQLPIDAAIIEDVIRSRFAERGDAVVADNIAAFRAGRESAPACDPTAPPR
jgi:indolepyruvate ferredoxin oxidoreductase beta subunit